MRIKIFHETTYRFSSDVFLEPHYLRFKPRLSCYLKAESFNLIVSPEPAGISEHNDAENNPVHFCWFNGKTNGLRITAESVTEMNEYNPYEFLIYPSEFLKIPFIYDVSLKLLLNPSLKKIRVPKKIIKYAGDICGIAGHDAVNCLTALMRKVHDDFTVKSRDRGSPHDPSFTFEKKEGSCRDLAWMCIQILRHMGVASRFVSGYYYIPDSAEFELHAWLEAYVPGAGWIGLDPSHGILTGERHVPVAASAFYENAMPVTGTVRGSAESVMEARIAISEA